MAPETQGGVKVAPATRGGGVRVAPATQGGRVKTGGFRGECRLGIPMQNEITVGTRKG